MNHGKSITFRACVALTVLLCTTGAARAYEAVQTPGQLTYPPLGDIRIPNVERVTLANGMRLLVLEDHEVPLINVAARIRAGSQSEPAEKVGLATITGAVLRTGGTHARASDELNEELENMAASLETGIGLDAGYASLSVLAPDVHTGLAILADVLMHPAFEEDQVRLAKMQLHSAISRRNDSLSEVASREFSKLIYGQTSEYARQPEYRTIDSITREDLVEFHRRYFGPDSTILAVWGDFETEELVAEIAKAFDGWKKVESMPSEVPEVNYQYQQAVSLIKKPGVSQSYIALGHIGGLKTDPDYFALTVIDQILGSSLTGRLFRNIRSRQGLAYSVSESYGMDYCHPGILKVFCQSSSNHTVRAIRALISEISRISREEVTDEELAIAKEGYLNSFVFNFDTAGEIVTRLMLYEYYGYPAEFLQNVKQGIERVTKAEILEAAQKHLHADAMQILVVGAPEDFDEPLTVLGPVKEIDINIPASHQ